MRPTGRGRKATTGGAPATPAPPTPRSAKSTPGSDRKRAAEFQHVHSRTVHQGHHKFGTVAGRAKCVVCVMLGDTASAWTTTGCSRCGIQSNSKGLRMCEAHWNTELGAAVHHAGGRTADFPAKLDAYYAEVDGRTVLRPLAEPERPPSASKKARKQHAKGETKTIGDFEREIAQRETEIAWRKAEIARLAAESDSMESN